MTTRHKNGGKLADGFADLEPFVAAWALGTEAERTARRHGTEMKAIQAFYDAILPRIDEILERALDGCLLNELTGEQKRLHYLTLSLCEIAPSIELYKQQEVVDGFDPARFPRVDIPNMTLPEN